MKSKITVADFATSIFLALALLSAAVSIKMAMADEIISDDGTYEEGVQAGEMNGGMAAYGVYSEVIAKKGCAAIEEYKERLNNTLSSLKASGVEASQYNAGVLQGYKNTIAQSITHAREECFVADE